MLNQIMIIALSVCAVYSQSNESFSLDEYRWKNRIIIINNGPDKLTSDRQKQLLLKDIAGLQERHLLIFEIGQDLIRDILNEKNYEIHQNLLDKLDLNSGAYEILLIGKDGGVKLRSSVPVTDNEIYNLIDQMPMRQVEMQKQKLR